jgi:lysosomal Pro-X carboxypeptidase
MLAAWMRMKYPHVIQGSLAASAPVLLFKGANGIDLEGGFGKIASDDFNVTGSTNDTCYLGMKDAFTRLISKKNDSTFITGLKDSFKTCDMDISSEANVTALTDLVRNGFVYMAMTDYPYDSSFLEPMPGYPIN